MFRQPYMYVETTLDVQYMEPIKIMYNFMLQLGLGHVSKVRIWVRIRILVRAYYKDLHFGQGGVRVTTYVRPGYRDFTCMSRVGVRNWVGG